LFFTKAALDARPFCFRIAKTVFRLVRHGSSDGGSLGEGGYFTSGLRVPAV
jgi:hypothetical protein